LKISIEDIKDTDYACDALILPFTEDDSGFYDKLGLSLSKLIKKIFSKEFRGKPNEVLLIHSPEGFKPERILFVGLGKKDKVSSEQVIQAGGKAAAYLRNMGMQRLSLSTSLLSSLDLSAADFVEGALLGIYTFKKYIEEKDKKKIKSLTVLSKNSNDLAAKLRYAGVVSSAVCSARDLINTPANDMTPTHLAETARSLRKANLSVKVLEKRDVSKLGMGAYLSVAKGSKEPPKFIILEYKGVKGPPLVLIGKSITFDSGGISLKPADGMEKMKYDMAGGAAVLGIFKALSELRLPVHVIGILPATENLIGESATRPGDVVRAINGKTIEIISTDAEGRMTLADAIAYARRFKPKGIIDIATLTGACSIAFGNVAIAMMGNDRELLDIIKRSGDNVYERVWEMPLFKEYGEYIISEIADCKNSGGRSGSLMSSAYFLSEFAGDVPWVHLDIAGTAWQEKERPYSPKGASGIGVRLIINLIKELK
jgi:leucyl aminopeptidase